MDDEMGSDIKVFRRNLSLSQLNVGITIHPSDIIGILIRSYHLDFYSTIL